MRIFILVARLIFGLFWLIFGLNGFLHFFPTPAPTAEAADFMDALMHAGYVMPLIYATQVIAGISLLSGWMVPLALIMLGPVVGNIVLYDAFLNPAGLVIGMVVLVIYMFLLYAYRQAFLPLLARPAT